MLSGDMKMLEAYLSGDPYTGFARLCGVPSDHASRVAVRNVYKTVVLGVGYQMTEHGLAKRLGCSIPEAKAYLEKHRTCFPDYWRWVRDVCCTGSLRKTLHSSFGWTLHVSAECKTRTLANFPCQANGAEMMRLAAIYAEEDGVRLCAPNHDAFLIEAPIGEIDWEIERMKDCMDRASAVLLSGVKLKVDVRIARYPQRLVPTSGLWSACDGLQPNPTLQAPCPLPLR